MGKRVWKVKWRARPAPDGEERLSRAIRLLLEAARSGSSERRTGPGAASHSQEPGANRTLRRKAMTQRTALYARVSTTRQQEERTVASQLATLEKAAEGMGLVVAAEHRYVDEGYSGSRLDRPGLDCAAGRGR
jgi:hypothetical protein